MGNKNKTVEKEPQKALTEQKVVKRQLKPSYFGAIAILVALVMLALGAGLYAYSHTKGWHVGIISGERYYCSSFFKRASGPVLVDGELLCFNERGELADGIVRVGAKTFVANADGTAANGEVTVGDSLYYVKDGEALCEFKSLGDGLYEPVGAKVGADGAISAGGERFALTDGLLRRGLVTLDSVTYGYDEHGGLVSGAAVIDGKTYLFDDDGRLLVNTRRDGWSSDANGEAKKIALLAAEGAGVMTQDAEPSAELSAELDKILAEIVNGGMDERARIRAVYDWICESLYWGNGNFTMEDDFPRRLNEAAESALARGDGRSQHYSALAYYMLKKLGFQTIVVKGRCVIPYGEFRDSYWCMTALEGGWYHLDPYCEDYESKYDCFLVTDADIKGISHDWDAGSLPASAA